MDLVESTFVKPQNQPALDGAEGLTDEDLAKSLNIRAIDFKDRFFELGHDKVLRELGLNFEIIAEKSGTRGRPKQVLVFSTDVARILVANYPNNIGMGYAAWLVKRAHHHFEEVVADNMRLRNENNQLAENQKSAPRTTPRRSTKRFDTVALTAKLFGLPFMKVKMGLQEMTPFQRLMASVIHDLRSAKGSNKAAFEKVLQAAEDLQGRFAYEELKDKLGDMSKFMFEIAMSVVEGEDPDKET